MSKNWKDTSQNLSTQCDSSSDHQEQNLLPILKTNPLKHKTQLCKTFSELGFCNYGEKCRFAHGKHQLLNHMNNKLHKDRKCKGFWKNGVCPYGIRCQFGHCEKDWTLNSYLIAQVARITQNQYSKRSRLLRIL